jgi:hypothetical protein
MTGRRNRADVERVAGYTIAEHGDAFLTLERFPLTMRRWMPKDSGETR